MNQSISQEDKKSQIASINDEISNLKSKISDKKKFCKSNGPTIKEKVAANIDINILTKKIEELKVKKAELKNSGIKKMANEDTKSVAPVKEKKVNEDITIDGHYFEDGIARKKSEVFADEELKKAYQNLRKKERRQARNEAKKAETAEVVEETKTEE